ncbi:RPE65 domain containing protein, partial [Asbolus verrucosus]
MDSSHPPIPTDSNQSQNFYPNFHIDVWLRSCEQEVTEPIMGAITGTIPLWLNGSLLRNGPGSLKIGDDYFQHLFDSSALLHRFCIENGQVTYQCRFLQSEVFKKNTRANRIVLTEFGTRAVPDPCRTIFQ